MRAFVAVLACLTSLLAVAGPSAAATRHAPPGNSSVDEYTETIPGPKGDHPVPLSGPVLPGPGSSSPVGGNSGVRKLHSLGPDGFAVERFAAHTGPRRGLDRDGGALPDVDGRSLPEQILDALGGAGEGGMGAILPLLLLASALGAFAVARRRRRDATPA
jgi:hypothetical protein